MVRIGPVFWRCRCGANVFHKRRERIGLVYVCNACGEMYEGS